MRLSYLKHSLPGFKSFTSAYVGGMYPEFVFGKEQENNVIPVFCYHRIGEEIFRGHLQYLKKNGYITLTSDELHRCLTGQGEQDRKHVVLTFDDGLDDLYSDVYPLLQEFGFTAVAYVIPGWIGKRGFITWPQVKEMHESGSIDFQSHSMGHSSIYTSPRIVDFFHPHFSGYGGLGIPVESEGNGERESRKPAFGTPIYTLDSRLSDSPRYFPDDNMRDLCVSYVAGNGGEDFFKSPRWRQKLRRLVKNYNRGNSRTDSYESEAEQEKAIMYEIEESKRMVERKLPGKVVNHFAFPWDKSGVLAKKALLEVGYLTMSAGLAKNYQHSSLGDSSFEVARVNGDFVPTLPGTGRQEFWKVMWWKMKRRVHSGRPY